MAETGFSISIDKWCQEAGSKAERFATAFALALMNEIKAKTPVDTGRLRASWSPSTDLSSWHAGEPLMISTNVEYALRIEYGFEGRDALGRSYHQVGVGMMTSTLADADRIAEQVLAQIGAA